MILKEQRNSGIKIDFDFQENKIGFQNSSFKLLKYSLHKNLKQRFNLRNISLFSHNRRMSSIRKEERDMKAYISFYRKLNRKLHLQGSEPQAHQQINQHTGTQYQTEEVSTRTCLNIREGEMLALDFGHFFLS